MKPRPKPMPANFTKALIIPALVFKGGFEQVIPGYGNTYANKIVAQRHYSPLLHHQKSPPAPFETDIAALPIPVYVRAIQCRRFLHLGREDAQAPVSHIQAKSIPAKSTCRVIMDAPVMHPNPRANQRNSGKRGHFSQNSAWNPPNLLNQENAFYSTLNMNHALWAA